MDNNFENPLIKSYILYDLLYIIFQMIFIESKIITHRFKMGSNTNSYISQKKLNKFVYNIRIKN